MRTLRIIAPVLVLAGLLPAAKIARADYGDICPGESPGVCVNDPTRFAFYGHVYDPLLRTISQVTITDYYDASLNGMTDSQGSYIVHVDKHLPGNSYELVARSDAWMGWAYWYDHDDVLGMDKRADFILSYRIRDSVSPSYTAQPGDDVVLSITARIPDPSTVCMHVDRYTDPPTAPKKGLATFRSTDAGITTWTFDDGVVPDNTPKNASLQFNLTAEDCETRTILGTGTDGVSVP